MNDNRRKLTGILKLLYENTDAEHSMDTYQIMDALESMGYGRPYRKTIDSNIKYLIEDMGMGIRKEKGKPNRYRWVEREFELSELKMLVDAVHSSRFISRRKSREIIAKLQDLTSVYQAATLNREMYAGSHFKRDESVALHNADIINEAIKSRQRIRFKMSSYDMNKNEVIDPDGQVYEVSPYALFWNNDYYYMLGMPANENEVHAYRIDRMKDVFSLRIESAPEPHDFDLERYSSCVFDMCTGETCEVTLGCKSNTMNDLIDRFGKDFRSEQSGPDTFNATISVDTSPAFYAWVFRFGGDVKILQPQNVKQEYEQMLRSQLQ